MTRVMVASASKKTSPLKNRSSTSPLSSVLHSAWPSRTNWADIGHHEHLRRIAVEAASDSAGRRDSSAGLRASHSAVSKSSAGRKSTRASEYISSISTVQRPIPLIVTIRAITAYGPD
jgi:hypothetical protein